MTPVAFLGLGAMGLPMAINLVRTGTEVRGFDMRREAVDAFTAAGGIPSAAAAEAADGAAALVLMVVNVAQAESALFDTGALDALAADAVVVLMATCPPLAVERLSERVASSGRRFLDAPVSGGVGGAEAGSLTIMVGGEGAAFEAARPLLEAFGSKIYHVGERPGQGATVKAINQLLCGVHLAAAAEALSLAERLGVDGRAVLDVVGGSAASSWMLRDRGPRMLEDAPPVNSAVDIFVKDLGIVLDAGGSARAALPLAAVARQQFLAASGQGRGSEDDSKVIEAYRAVVRRG